MSTPVSRRSFSSVRLSSARPPGKRRVKTSWKHLLTPSKVSANRFREMALIRVIVVWSVVQGGVQIGDLGGEEFVAGLQLLVLGQGQEIDLAEVLDGLAVLFQLCAQLRDRLVLERLEIRDELGEVRRVLLLDVLLEVFHLHRDLPEGHLQLVSFAEQPVEDLLDLADLRLPRPEEGLLFRWESRFPERVASRVSHSA